MNLPNSYGRNYLACKQTGMIFSWLERKKFTSNGKTTGSVWTQYGLIQPIISCRAWYSNHSISWWFYSFIYSDINHLFLESSTDDRMGMFRDWSEINVELPTRSMQRISNSRAIIEISKTEMSVVQIWEKCVSMPTIMCHWRFQKESEIPVFLFNYFI